MIVVDLMEQNRRNYFLVEVLSQQMDFSDNYDDTDPSGFGLSSNGEKVWLENASGTLIDTCAFPRSNRYRLTSYGRFLMEVQIGRS